MLLVYYILFLGGILSEQNEKNLFFIEYFVPFLKIILSYIFYSIIIYNTNLFLFCQHLFVIFFIGFLCISFGCLFVF